MKYDFADSNKLVEAYLKAKKDTEWKESVQRYEMNLLQNIHRTSKAIENGTYKQLPTVQFTLHERGHTRCIKSHHISDRIVQRSFNDNVLVPAVLPKLFYNNGASLKGKGISFSRKLYERDLQRAFELYGDKACVLYIDISKYFDNIVHDVSLKQYANVVSADYLEFLTKMFKDFEVDVSYMDEVDFLLSNYDVFNSLEYSKLSFDKTGEKMMRKSVGIGNQTSQTTGIFYPTPVDNFVTCVKGQRLYGRYMDDSYVMNEREVLEALLPEIIKQYRKLGIQVNMKKTKIVPIRENQTYLKINYEVLDSGKLIRKIHNSTIRRERTKLRKYKVLLEQGRVEFKDIKNWFRSWLGTYKHYDSKHEIYEITKFFKGLFKEEIENDT